MDDFLVRRQSYSKQQDIWKTTFFETPKAANERKLKRQSLEEQGLRKKKKKNNNKNKKKKTAYQAQAG